MSFLCGGVMSSIGLRTSKSLIAILVVVVLFIFFKHEKV